MIAFGNNNLREKAPYNVGSLSSNKSYMTKPKLVKKAPQAAALIVAQVSYQNVPR